MYSSFIKTVFLYCHGKHKRKREKKTELAYVWDSKSSGVWLDNNRDRVSSDAKYADDTDDAVNYTTSEG